MAEAKGHRRHENARRLVHRRLGQLKSRRQGLGLRRRRKRKLKWRPADLLLLLRRTLRGCSEDKIPKLAAGLAYYTAFSVAPILVIAIAAAGLVFGAEAARGAISRELSGVVGSQIGEGIQALLRSAWQPKAGLIASILGGVALIFGATGVFGELQDSFNIIWKVQKPAGHGLWGTLRSRFLSFTMVLGIGFLLLVSLALSAALEALGKALSGWAGEGFVIHLLDQGISLLVIAGLFAALFKILPDARTRWRDVGAGAILTAALFTLGKFLISLYLGKSSIGSTYGAAGSFVLFLLWVYYSSHILFFGAEFTKAWAETHGSPPRPRSEGVRTMNLILHGGHATQKEELPMKTPQTAEPSKGHRRGLKLALVAGGILLVLPFLFVLGIVLGINPIVKFGVQNLGRSALKVPVHLGHASISFAGEARLGAFRIANPPGFALAEAGSFDALYARVPLASAFRSEIDIPELTVEHPEFTFELRGKHHPSNWGVLMKSLAASLPVRNVPPTPDHEKTFRIEKIRIISPVIHFRAPPLPQGITLHLKDIELRNVGTAPGVRSKTYVFLASILQALLTGGLHEGKELPSDVTGPFRKELSEAAKTFGEVLLQPRR
ncbi:MAG TPA: YihY/virulence factor BrkB family protein [Planctomycetota bacterium]|nr:YihY/virulence factor BrkB family protein [Planctomycetota bacterium]